MGWLLHLNGGNYTIITCNEIHRTWQLMSSLMFFIYMFVCWAVVLFSAVAADTAVVDIPHSTSRLNLAT